MFCRKDKGLVSELKAYFIIQVNLKLILLTSFEQQLFRYHQMIHRAAGSVLEFNIIKPGLNFLVPNEWWAEFMNRNKNVSSWNDITIPHEHPLNILFELGMLYLPNFHSDSDLARFETKAQNIALNLAKTFRHVKRAKMTDCDSKCIQQALQILNFNKFQETSMEVLLCPQVENRQIKELMFDTFQWKIVTPYTYRAISQKVLCKIGNESIKNIIGVPIFLDQCTELQDFTNKSYCIGAQVQANIFISSLQGAKYSVIGYLQQKMSYEEIMRHLFEGLNNLMNRECLNNNYFTKRCLLVFNNQQVYENFMPKHGVERKILSDQINLKYWYDNFSGGVPSKRFQIFQFGGKLKENQYSFKRINQNTETFDNMEPSKKIKQNESKIAGYAQVYSKTKGFQPTIIQQSDLRHEDVNERYIPRSEMIIQLTKTTKPKRQNHSSTEEDTPGVIQESIQNEMRRNTHKDESRITFPLWKSEHNRQALIKLASVRMNDHISVPFYTKTSLMRKLQCGERVFLGGKTNLLSINCQGQMIEQENSSSIQDTSKADVVYASKMLEDLALEIVKSKEEAVLSVKSEGVQTEPSKEKINVETQACKNEIIDELDEVESREC